MSREILVWGGTHADEQLGMEVADSLVLAPIPHVYADIANVAARAKANYRYVDINMNDGFPGSVDSQLYEERRATEILAMCHSRDWFVIVDFHNNNYEGANTACIGSKGTRPEILGFLAEIGLTRLVLTQHNSLREHVSQGILLEIMQKGGKHSTVEYWRQAFNRLANRTVLPIASPTDFEWFKATHELTTDDFNPKDLTGNEQPFGRLSPDMEARLGLEHPQHWLVLNRHPKTKYWAELCTPVQSPNPADWENWPIA